ncbi:MAG: acetate/propionate family kinase [Candidatus Zipacnadales bacterium]
MKLLVINCGSSSVKYALYEMRDELILSDGLADRVGVGGGDNAELTHRVGGHEMLRRAYSLPDHSSALALIVETLTSPPYGVLYSVNEIEAVGHRVVHGGTRYSGSVLITDEVIRAVEACIELGPLHNPPNLAGIRACMALLPNTPQVAVFDTAFGQSMPSYAYHYAIPYELYERRGIRRYGFHGTSHRYVASVAAELLERRNIALADQRVITCHLGNGCSMAAVAGGRCIDTSMGLTPLEGLVMGTRSGDIDPAIVWFIMEKEALNSDEVDVLLNKQSGLLGLSGISSDMRDILTAAQAGHQRARLAIDVYCYRVRKYIGAYAAALGGVDAVVFTAGVGENSPPIRAQCLEGLGFLGLLLDEAANETAIGGNKPCDIASARSPARIFVIPTDEELTIARDTQKIVATMSQSNYTTS